MGLTQRRAYEVPADMLVPFFVIRQKYNELNNETGSMGLK